MKKKVLSTVGHFGLLAPGDRILVAVSGGADSLCLIHLLHSLSGKLGISLHVAYINHGLRPEAAAEARYVKRWASRLELPFTACRVDVKSLKTKHGLSGLDAARRLRYSALQRIAARTGSNRIATAHHCDDRLETLLIRLLSGSGLDGLAGLPAKRQMAEGLTLIRPLYNCWRSEIEAYCRQFDLAPVFDRSNLDHRYLRNRVRLSLLPFLEEQFGLHVRRGLVKTGELLADDSALLAGLTEQSYRDAVKKENGCFSLDLEAWHKVPRALQARLLRKMMWECGVERPSRTHVNAMLGLAQSGSPSASVSLPSQVTARREYGFLRLLKQENREMVTTGVQALSIPGHTLLPGGKEMITAAVLPAAAINLKIPDRKQAYLDFGLLKYPVVVRSRQAGDRVRLLGAPGSRKLKSILIDRKIPLAKRQAILLVESGGEIAWVAGVDIAHNFRVTPETNRVLHLKMVSTTMQRDGEGE